MLAGTFLGCILMMTDPITSKAEVYPVFEPERTCSDTSAEVRTSAEAPDLNVINRFVPLLGKTRLEQCTYIKRNINGEQFYFVVYGFSKGETYVRAIKARKSGVVVVDELTHHELGPLEIDYSTKVAVTEATGGEGNAFVFRTDKGQANTPFFSWNGAQLAPVKADGHTKVELKSAPVSPVTGPEIVFPITSSAESDSAPGSSATSR